MTPSKPLSWTDIRSNATSFVYEWHGTKRERAEAQTFVNEFFAVFGINRKRVSSFEHAVKKLNSNTGFIDAFWPGKLIIEMKSAGKDLNAAIDQAFDYFSGLDDAELPKFVMVSDFARIALHDVETRATHEFKLEELAQNIHLFGFIAGYQTRTHSEQDPVNIQAAEKMGRLHDRMEEIGYSGHELQVYLVRLLFCLFAEDTGIFNSHQFQDIVEYKSSSDGRDLAGVLSHVFDTLNTPIQDRMSTLDEDYARLPYVNGKLFAETLRPPAFDAQMRESLLEACRVDWSGISPAIFGSLFQSVMNPEERRNLGAHYTSEENILKVIRPLFLDELWERYEKVKGSVRDLTQLHKHIASIRILDPACGCGNFLVIAYRELRRLELEILNALDKHGQRVVNIQTLVLLNVDMMCGIELEEFPAQIAQVALWLVDHQMNLEVAAAFGEYFRRLPLSSSPSIHNNDALTTEWLTLTGGYPVDFILGNPPFKGAKYLSETQRQTMSKVFEGWQNAGLLDFVSSWFKLAREYMILHPHVRTAFVATNSITQGEQVSVLWPTLLSDGFEIDFAYPTFTWTSASAGKAAVDCVIVGFSTTGITKRLWQPGGFVYVKSISPYLTEEDIIVTARRTPLCKVPKAGIGNKPIDDGNYLFYKAEMEEFLKREPGARSHFRRWFGTNELLKGEKYQRWCLWLGDCTPQELAKMPLCLERIEAVKDFRLKSKSEDTRRLARTPTRFHVENFPSGGSLLIPKVSSERRDYVPLGFITPPDIASDLVSMVPNATLYHFGVLQSAMHMTWLRAVGGRHQSRYRYSLKLVYNTFPWPNTPATRRRLDVERSAQLVLDVRKSFSDSSLEELYDPRTMPVELSRAHAALDRIVDLLYRPQRFPTEAHRLSHLFERYRKLIAEE